MMKNYTEPSFETQQELVEDELMISNGTFNLIVWNDNKNTFEWVIETLIEVCKHTHEQAEQCACIIHFNGKYAVKNGDYDLLKPMKDTITERGINATIEEMVES